MATKEATTQTAPGDVEITPEQAEIAQLEARITVQDHRIKELAGYQAQARDLADGNTALIAQVQDLSSRLEQATRDTAQAQAAALNAAASASVDQGVVAHAQALAAAVKGLLGK